MTPKEFLASCSKEEFDKHLSTLDRDGIRELRLVLTEKAARHRRYEVNVDRVMEQLKATEKRLATL